MTLHNIPQENFIPSHIKATAVLYDNAFHRPLLYKNGFLYYSNRREGAWIEMPSMHERYPNTGHWLFDARVNSLLSEQAIDEFASEFSTSMLRIE